MGSRLTKGETKFYFLRVNILLAQFNYELVRCHAYKQTGKLAPPVLTSYLNLREAMLPLSSIQPLKEYWGPFLQ